MSDPNASFKFVHDNDHDAVLVLSGAWVQGSNVQGFAAVSKELQASAHANLLVDGAALDGWDSTLMAFMLQCYNYCSEEGIGFDTRDLPSGAQKLLTLATAVAPLKQAESQQEHWLASLSPRRLAGQAGEIIRESLAFTGEITIALGAEADVNRCCSSIAAFDSTLTWEGVVEIRDGADALVSDFMISSESGANYGEPIPVLEPAGVEMALASLMTSAFLVRVRRSAA